MIEAVLFDLDETLLDRRRSLVAFLNHQWSAHSQLQGIAREEFSQKFLQLDDNGRVWKDRVYTSLLKKFDIKNLDPADLLQDYVSNFSAHATLFPGVIESVTALKNRGLKLGIITNGKTDLQSSVIQACDLNRFMNIILISEAVGFSKPDPRIFQKALDGLNVRPEACVFVGDNPDADIKGAKNCGMKTLWAHCSAINSIDTNLQTAILTAYKDLPQLIETL